MPYYAHSLKNDPDRSRWQPLAEHLISVARLAEDSARAARPGDDDFAHAARLAGLLHDLGKYRPEFQATLALAVVRQSKSIWCRPYDEQLGMSCEANADRWVIYQHLPGPDGQKAGLFKEFTSHDFNPPARREHAGKKLCRPI